MCIRAFGTGLACDTLASRQGEVVTMSCVRLMQRLHQTVKTLATFFCLFVCTIAKRIPKFDGEVFYPVQNNQSSLFH